MNTHAFSLTAPRRANRRIRFANGDASQLITHQSIFPDDRVVLFGRVSRCSQKHNGNLGDQIKFLSEFTEKMSANVVGIFQISHSGWADYGSRGWLLDAVGLAMRLDAKILAESTDRFVRHPHYHSNRRPDLQAPNHDLQELAMWTEGVSLHTYLHPNATPQEVRSHQRKRGQRAKKSYGGNFSASRKSPDPEVQRVLDRKAVCKLRKSIPPPRK